MRAIVTLIIGALLIVSPAFADETINQLGNGTTLTGTEQIPMFQTANPAVTTTPNAIKTFIAAPTAANPTGTAGPSAVNGSATTFMRSDGAPAVQKGSASQFGIVEVDGTSITASGGVISATGSSGANPTATAGPSAINGSATTFMRSDGAPAIQLGSNSQKGIVEVDGTTISATSGVISAVNTGTVTSISAGCGTSTGGSPITSTGTISSLETVSLQTGSNYAFTNGNCGQLVNLSNSSAQTPTIAQAGSGGNFASGWYADVCNVAAGTQTITPTTSTIGGNPTKALTTGQCIRIVSDGTNYQVAGTGTGSGGGGSPGGSNTDIQFNSSSSFAGDSGFTYAGSGGEVIAAGALISTKNGVDGNGYGGLTIVVSGQPGVGMSRNSSVGGLDLTGDSTAADAMNISTSVNGTITINPVMAFGFDSSGVTQSLDTMFTRKTAATMQLGYFDAAAPVAQALTVQSVVAGTANTAGSLWKFKDSAGTGTGVSGGYEFDVAPASGSGSTQNSYSSALTIAGGTGLVALPKIGSDATHTDATVCEDTTSHALYSGSGTAGICLGTSSLRFKHDISPLDQGLDQVLALRPIDYKYNAGYGDPNQLLYGFAAEQVASVVPELVHKDANGRPNSLDYMGIVPILVRAIQQQQAEINDLRARVK